jgi:D-alanyl-D-alanine carboxypeptidase
MYAINPTRTLPPRAARITLVLAVVASALALVLSIGGIAFAMLTSDPNHAPGTVGTAHDPSATGEAGGLLPDGTSPFDNTPGVTGLEPALLAALQNATNDAAEEDIQIIVNSGWRSEAYQQQLLNEAVVTYGSEKEASRWVATPATSAHVHGDAVDVGSYDATAWLSERGAAYGLCQIYENESWHYELRPDAVTDGCPTMFRDPTEDPRMQR